MLTLLFNQSVLLGLQGSAAGVASTSAALSVSQSLTGASNGASTASGNLTVEGPAMLLTGRWTPLLPPVVSLAGVSEGIGDAWGKLTVTPPDGAEELALALALIEDTDLAISLALIEWKPPPQN